MATPHSEQLELANPDLACALLPEGPGWGLEVSALRAMRYIELNLDLHERLWQQHQDGIFGDEEWEPWHRWFWDGSSPAKCFGGVGVGPRLLPGGLRPLRRRGGS